MDVESIESWGWGGEDGGKVTVLEHHAEDFEEEVTCRPHVVRVT